MNKIAEIINYVETGQSKLNEKALNLEGMSNQKVRDLLNKACSYENTSYLEIGVYKGSTFYSALYKNSLKYAVAIDNFSQFDSNEDLFLSTIADLEVPYTFFNTPSFSTDLSIFKHKINTYFYDGDHSYENQEKALTYFYDIFEDNFIYICDDYDWEIVQKGTHSGIKKANLKIVEEYTLSRSDNYWNGIYIAELSKN
jgi:hypothetical protein